MQFGVIPICDKRFTTDPHWVRGFLAMLEAEGAESVWMPEHVVMADDYEPRYEYSADGRAPVAPDTMMPDPLEWLAFAAACTERLGLATGVLVGPQHSAAMLAKRLATLDALSGARVRVGIGRPPGRQDVADFVLSNYSSAERKILPFQVDKAADAVESLVTEGLERTQQNFNS